MTMLKNGNTCPVCEAGTLHENFGNFSFTYKNERFLKKNVKEFMCAQCGETFIDRAEEKQLERQAIEFRRKVDGLLTPSEIKAVRNLFNCTQVEFARLLGIGDKSFARYENGSVAQSKAMDIALRLIRNDPQGAQSILCR